MKKFRMLSITYWMVMGMFMVIIIILICGINRFKLQNEEFNDIIMTRQQIIMDEWFELKGGLEDLQHQDADIIMRLEKIKVDIYDSEIEMIEGLNMVVEAMNKLTTWKVMVE